MGKSNDNDNKEYYVLTLPLNVAVWQEHILLKRFEMLRKVYNAVQSKMLKKYKYYSSLKDENGEKKYKNGYKILDIEEEQDYKISKKGCENKKKVVKPFTKFGLIDFVYVFNRKDGECGLHKINSNVLIDVASNCYTAWEKFLKGNGKNIHFKKFGELTSYKVPFDKKRSVSNGISLDLEKNVVRVEVCKPNKKNSLKYKRDGFIEMPFNVTTEYERHALKSEIKYIGFKTEVVRGKNKFYIQFTIKGKPYQKKDRKLGKGNVGIDIGTSTSAICSLHGVSHDVLGGEENGSKKQIDIYQRKISVLQRKLDRSRRATNPDNFNEDGTIKKGKKLVWKKSNNYKKLQASLKEVMRKQAAKRKLSHINLANRYISYGNVFNIEKVMSKSWGARAKKTTYKKDGRPNRKKRYGKTIAHCAPSMFKTILENKVKALGGVVNTIPCGQGNTQFDFTDCTFRKIGLGQRKKKLSNGRIHSRDLMSAFNLMHVVNYKSSEKSVANYDIQSMKKHYNKYVMLEKVELEKHSNGEKQTNCCMAS